MPHDLPGHYDDESEHHRADTPVDVRSTTSSLSSRVSVSGGRQPSFLYDSLSREFGIDIDEETIVSTGTTSRIMVPSEAVWDNVVSQFYAKVDAKTKKEKFLCLCHLIKWFIVNTTSDKADYTTMEVFPTGASGRIVDVWKVPYPYSRRAILRHPTAQKIAAAVNTASATLDEMKAIAIRRGHNVQQMETAYDFYFPDTNPYGGVQRTQGMYTSRRNRVRGTRAEDNIGDAAVRGRESQSGSGGKGFVSESFYGETDRG